MEIKRPGPTLGAALGTGGGAATRYRPYLPFQEDGDAVLKALLSEIDNVFGPEGDYSSSGDDGCILGGGIACRNSARKRYLIIPTRRSSSAGIAIVLREYRYLGYS